MGWINIAIGVILLALALINPRSLWHATTGWRYRDPDAHEPSEDALFLGRVGRALMGVLSILLGIYVNGGFEPAEGSSRAAAEQVAATIRAGGPVELSIYDDGSDFEFRVESRLDWALVDAEATADLKIGDSTVGDDHAEYTLQDSSKEKFCLTVSETGRSAPKAPDTPTGNPHIDVAIQVGLTDGSCRGRRYAVPSTPTVGQ